MKKPVDVYLAGGMKSGWQDRVRADLRKLKERGLVRWNDPRDNLTKNQGEIKLLSAVRIKTADIVFANEQDRDSQIAAINLEIKFLILMKFLNHRQCIRIFRVDILK